jgi:hypothetical protein
VRVVALALLLYTTPALAEPEAFVAPSRAAQLFSEGRELKAAGRIDEACARFAVSWQAEHAPGTEVNLADCREREGKLLEAWQLFDEAARVSQQQGNTTRAEFARNRAAAIDARLMTIEVKVAPPFARAMTITLDGKPLAIRATTRERIDPKPVWVRASAPGGTSYAVQVPAQAGTVVIDVPSLVRTTEVRRRSRLWIAGGLVLAGAGAFVASGRLMMLADDQREGIEGCTLDSHHNGTCIDDRAKQTAERTLALAAQNDLASKILLGGGAAAVVAGAIVWYTAPKERVVITPTATTSSVGVSLATRF